MNSKAVPTLSPRAERRATGLIYFVGFTYHIGLGATLLLVPLYGLYLGFALDELGVIIASQAVLGLFLRLFAGAIADRFGERWVILISFGTMVIGAAIIGISTTFWPLIIGQTFLGISRATYWTATQSYCSRINPAKSGTVLGRMTSSRMTGQMVGAALAGFMAEALGYGFAWAILVGLGVFGLLGSAILPILPRKDVIRGFGQALAPIPSMARDTSMAMAGYTSFVASTAMTMAVILLVPYFRDIGNGETRISILLTIGLIGSVVIGIIFGKVVSYTGQRKLYLYTLFVLGLVMWSFPIWGNVFVIMIAIMLLHGVLYGTLSALYPLTAATYSSDEQRGLAMAYVGLYWAVAQIAVPASFGVIAENFGLKDSFWIAGVMFLIFAVSMPILFPRLTKHRGLD
tara:strand:+ start:7036 stop:8241 length:1206 start_codon:yes stop_codon:yes gene_type:complete